MSMTSPATPTAVDLMAPEMFDDPFPVYARLRAENPVPRVKWKQGMRGGGYMLTRYDDVMRLHTDKVFSSDAKAHGTMPQMRFAPKSLQLLTESMVFKDDPEHQRLRSLVNRAFTPKLVQAMSDDIDGRRLGLPRPTRRQGGSRPRGGLRGAGAACCHLPHARHGT